MIASDSEVPARSGKRGKVGERERGTHGQLDQERSRGKVAITSERQFFLEDIPTKFGRLGAFASANLKCRPHGLPIPYVDIQWPKFRRSNAVDPAFEIPRLRAALEWGPKVWKDALSR